MSDPYTELGVLRNTVGAKTPTELAQREAVLSLKRIAQLHSNTELMRGDFGLEHFKRMHRIIFQDVYPWAGRTRNEIVFPGQVSGVNISKGGTQFTDCRLIETTAEKIQRQLSSEGFMRDFSRQDFSDRLANYYRSWNDLHPFREGNGRSTRALLHALCHEVGYILDASKIQRHVNSWNTASRQASLGDLSAIRETLNSAVRTPMSYVFEHSSHDVALKTFPQLISAVDAEKRVSQQILQMPTEQQGRLQQKVKGAIADRINDGRLDFSSFRVNLGMAKPQAPAAPVQKQQQAPIPKGPKL